MQSNDQLVASFIYNEWFTLCFMSKWMKTIWTCKGKTTHNYLSALSANNILFIIIISLMLIKVVSVMFGYILGTGSQVRYKVNMSYKCLSYNNANIPRHPPFSLFGRWNKQFNYLHIIYL